MRSMFQTISTVLQQVPKTVNGLLTSAGIQPTNQTVTGLKIYLPLVYALVAGALNDLSKAIPQGLGSALQDAPFWQRFARSFKFVDDNNFMGLWHVDSIEIWHAFDGDPYQYNQWLNVLLWIITNLKPVYVSQLLQVFQTFETQLTGFLITWGEQVYDYIIENFLPYNEGGIPNVPFISLVYLIVSPVTSTTPIMVPIGITYGAVGDLWNPNVCPSSSGTTVYTNLYLFSFYFFGPAISGSGIYVGQYFEFINYQGVQIGYDYNGTKYVYWLKVVYFGYKNSYLSAYGSGFTQWLINTWFNEGEPYSFYYFSSSAGGPTNIYNFAPNPVSAIFQTIYSLNISSPNAPNNTYVVPTAVGPLEYQVNTSVKPQTFSININLNTSPPSGVCSNIASVTISYYYGADWWLATQLSAGTSSLPSGIATVYAGVTILLVLIATMPYESWYYYLTNNQATLSQVLNGAPQAIIGTVRPVIYDFPEAVSDFIVSFLTLQYQANGLSFIGMTTNTVPSTGGFPPIILTSPEVEVSGNFKTLNLTVGTNNLYSVIIDVGTKLYSGLGKIIYASVNTVNPLGGTIYVVTTTFSTQAVIRPDYYVAEQGHFAPVSPSDLSSQYTPSGYYINTDYAIYLAEGTYTLDVTAVDSNNNTIYSGSLSVQANKPILYVPNGYGVYTSTGLVYTSFVPQVILPTQTSKPSPVVALATVLLLTLIGYFGSMKK